MIEVTMNGPGKNALGSTMMHSVMAQFEAAGGEPVLLTGAGDAFSAGLDLREVLTLEPQGMVGFLELLEKLLQSIYTYPGPVVALVNGHAIAGGCLVAMAADWRVASQGVAMKIGLNEVALGLRYPPRVLSLVKKRLEPRRVAEVVLGAGLHDAEGALRLGLLDEIAADARAAAAARLSSLAAHPRDGYGAAKRDVRGTLECSAEEDRQFREEGLSAWVAPELRARLTKALGR
jgi:enoyl-CoA hydratase